MSKKEQETLAIFFNVYMHCEGNHDVTKYEYTRILSHHKSKFNTFSIQNKYNVLPYIKYSNKNIVFIAILNNLKSRSFEIQENLNIKKFIKDLKMFKNNMCLDVEKVYNELEEIDNIYNLFNQDEIKFYSFFNLIKYLKFDKHKHIACNDMFVKRLKHQKRIAMLLDFKDNIVQCKYFPELQKKIDLIIE